MRLLIGRAGWMSWSSGSRRAFAGLSRAGGCGPICRACLLRLSARMAGSWPRTPAIVRLDGVQDFLARMRWDADQVRDDLQAYVIAQLGDADAVLVLDETGFIKIKKG